MPAAPLPSVSNRRIVADLAAFRPALDAAEAALALAADDTGRLAILRQVEGALSTLAIALAGRRRVLTLRQRALTAH